MKKRIKISIRILGVLLALWLIITAFSFFYPGHIKPVDQVRIGIQTVILDFTGENFVSDFTFSNKYKATTNQITYQELSNYISHMTTGDIFFTESVNYICAELTPGKWKHAVIYIGDRNQFEELYTKEDAFYDLISSHYVTGEEVLILDSSSFGVSIREIDNLSNLKELSMLKSVIGFRLEVSDEVKKNFIANAITFLGTKYDYDLNTNDYSALYCSELLYLALSGIDIRMDITSAFVGRRIITPTDAVNYLTKSDQVNNILYIEKENGSIIEELGGENYLIKNFN